MANRFGIATRLAPAPRGGSTVCSRTGWARTGLGAGAAALCLWAAGLGCLPDPVVHVPDFAPPPPVVDAAVPRPDGGPATDLGAATWAPDGTNASTESLRGCWVGDQALSAAYAVGNNGTILRRAGASWQVEVAKDVDKVVTETLYAVAALAPDQVYAVGDQGVILRRAADKWTREGKELRLTTALYGVTVLSSGEVIAVGDGGVIARRKVAGVWALEPVDMALARASFRAVWGTQDTDLIAVGTGAVVAQPSGGSWIPDPATIDAADRGNFYAVAATAEGPFVAGDYGRILRRSGGKWQREAIAEPMPRPTMPIYLFGLTAVQGELYAVGSVGSSGTGGLIERRDAASKTWGLEQSGLDKSLFAVAGAASRSVVAVGANGLVLRRM